MIKEKFQQLVVASLALFAEQETATVTNTTDRTEVTAALTGSFGNFSFGYQKDFVDEGQTTAAADADFPTHRKVMAKA